MSKNVLIGLSIILASLSHSAFAQCSRSTLIVEDEISQNPHLESITAQCRQAKNINLADKADAYPFLSADGLRLYFTSNREGGHGRFFISTRKNIDEPFETPAVLSRQLTEGYFCGTLTSDELTMYMAKDGSIYVSHRQNMKSEFGVPVKVIELDHGWMFGPTISPDGKELVFTTSEKSTAVNRLFRKDQLGIFREAGNLPSTEMIPGPAQFSKDGLSIYFGLKSKDRDSEKLYLYKRSAAGQPFANLEELPASIQVHTKCSQPSVSAGGTVLAYIISNGSWNEDDIIVTNLDGQNVPPVIPEPVVKRKVETISTIYPNPFHDHLVLELAKTPQRGTMFILYDMMGRMVKQENLADQRSNIQLDRVQTGAYLYRVVDQKGSLIAAGKVLKK